MLREPLELICRRLEGAVAASLIGADGIQIEAVRADPTQALSDSHLEAMWVEYAMLLRQVRSSAQMLAAGLLEEVMLSSEHMVTVIRPITPDVFLAFAVRADASSGKARYLCRVTAPRLIEAVS